MNEYLSSASLKSLAKGQLIGKYGVATGSCAIYFLYVLISSAAIFLLIDTTSLFGTITYFAASYLISVLGGIFLCGQAYIYLKLACHHPVQVNDLFWGFHNSPDKILKIQAVLSLISIICSIPGYLSNMALGTALKPVTLLFIVTGLLVSAVIELIINLMLSQCYFLMLDFPGYSVKEIFRQSCRIMKSSKGRLFYIELSFIPWFLLGICTCCLTFLWIMPYYQGVRANFYLDLMKKRKEQKT